jgi:hypothetical protein
MPLWCAGARVRLPDHIRALAGEQGREEGLHSGKLSQSYSGLSCFLTLGLTLGLTFVAAEREQEQGRQDPRQHLPIRVDPDPGTPIDVDFVS